MAREKISEELGIEPLSASRSGEGHILAQPMGAGKRMKKDTEYQSRCHDFKYKNATEEFEAQPEWPSNCSLSEEAHFREYSKPLPNQRPYNYELEHLEILTFLAIGFQDTIVSTLAKGAW